MPECKRISGWHRLWLVLLAIYLLLVVAISAFVYPQPQATFSQEERLKRSVALVAEYLKANPGFAKQPPILPSEYGGIPVDRSKIPDELDRLHAKYKGRVDFSAVENASAPDLTDERQRFIGMVFLIWFVPITLIYVLGLSSILAIGRGLSFAFVLGSSFYFGYRGQPVEMGLVIVAGSIVLAFLYIDKIQRFKGAGF